MLESRKKKICTILVEREGACKCSNKKMKSKHGRGCELCHYIQLVTKRATKYENNLELYFEKVFLTGSIKSLVESRILRLHRELDKNLNEESIIENNR